eukprot:jgi/Bigna1/59217/fgenesh1_kg.3_\
MSISPADRKSVGSLASPNVSITLLSELESDASGETCAPPAPSVVTVAGKHYIQNNPRVVMIPVVYVQPNNNEYRFWVRNIARRAKQVASILCIGTFLCFLSFFFGYVDTKPSKSWVIFTWSLLVIGVGVDASVVILFGCHFPEERSVDRCTFDLHLMVFWLLAFILLID